MRIVLAVASAALVAGCAKEQPVVQAPPPELTREDCYTVVLFDPVEIEEPAESVPAGHRAFLGHWKQGAWSGKWCHDFLVSAVHPDGSADVFDMHAPYAPWGKPATAFKRKARINDDNVMTFRHGTEVRRYRIVEGRLHAVRSGATGDLHAVLINPETDMQVASAVTEPVDMPETSSAADVPAAAPIKLAAADGSAEPAPAAAAPDPGPSLESVLSLPETGGFEGAGTAPPTSGLPPERGTTG